MNKRSDKSNIINIEKYKLDYDTPGYGSVYYAKNKQNSLGIVTSGVYFVFRRDGDYINLTTDSKCTRAGLWIDIKD